MTRCAPPGAPSTLVHGEAREALAALAPGSVDAFVTDPPAGIEFLGEAWDKARDRHEFVVAHAPIYAQALRAGRPGALAIVWALPRTSHWTACALEDGGWEILDAAVHLQAQGKPAARTRLKPAAEHWLLARTPGPVRALGIEACRVTGRWPANATLEHAPECGDAEGSPCVEGCPVALLDAQAGVRRSSGGVLRRGAKSGRGMGYGGAEPGSVGYAPPDSGGASRFYFCAKAKGNERAGNPHKTAKPLELMRWLVRLVSNPGELVCDPFAGSGTTLEACVREGRRFLGIEREARFYEYARARVERVGRELAGEGVHEGEKGSATQPRSGE